MFPATIHCELWYTYLQYGVFGEVYENTPWVVSARACVVLMRAPVAFGVHRHDVHGDVVLLARVQVAHLDAHGWKHPPEKERRDDDTSGIFNLKNKKVKLINY